MTTIDKFIQRQGTSADITYSGIRGTLYQGSTLIADSHNGIIRDVPQGDGYRLRIVNSDHSVTLEHIAIGAIVDCMGQSNIANWFLYSHEMAAAPHTYQYESDGLWGRVAGGGAREFTAELSADLNCPVAIVDSALRSTPLLEQDDVYNHGWWLNGPLYDDAVNIVNAIGGKVEDVLWAQGESDASNRVSASDYETGLLQFFGDVESDFGAPHIFMQEIGDIDHNVDRFYTVVRGVEDSVASELNYVDIGASGVGVALHHGGPDYTPAAYVLLGQEMASSVYSYDINGFV